MVFPWIPAVGDHPHVVRRDHGVLEFVGEHDCQRLVTVGSGPEAGRILRGRVCRRPADDDGSRLGVSQDQFHHAVRGDDAAGVDAHSARRGGQRQQGLDRHQERVHHTACGNRQAGIVRLDALRADPRT